MMTTYNKTGFPKRKKTRPKCRDKIVTNRACHVYGISDETGIRYIGQTRSTLELRFSYHKKSAMQNGDLGWWLMNTECKIIMIDEHATWDVSEIIWIERYKRASRLIRNSVSRSQTQTSRDFTKTSKKSIAPDGRPLSF